MKTRQNKCEAGGRRLGVPASSGPERRPAELRMGAGFTLLEVVIAIGIFFIVAFAVLGLMAQGLGAARVLQIRHADAGMLAAELSLTNSLAEGADSGDFGDIYPNYHWERNISEVGSNGLFQVDFKVLQRVGRKEVETTMSIWMYRPNSVRRSGLR